MLTCYIWIKKASQDTKQAIKARLYRRYKMQTFINFLLDDEFLAIKGEQITLKKR